MKTQVVQTCRMIIRPLALILLKCGMTWKEFAEVSKSVFVETATQEFGLNGRPTNVSRVSILTGISRKEVKRQRDMLLETELPLSEKTTDATRLLSAWHQDKKFLDENNKPAPLSMAGESPNFAELFSHYGGDTPEQTMVRELKLSKSVHIDEEGRLHALRRYYMPVAMQESTIRVLGDHLGSHAQTLSRNITVDGQDAARFEGSAIDDRIDPKYTDEFKQFLDSRGEQFLEEVDEWLSQHRVVDTSNNAVPIRLGVGLYAVQE